MTLPLYILIIVCIIIAPLFYREILNKWDEDKLIKILPKTVRKVIAKIELWLFSESSISLPKPVRHCVDDERSQKEDVKHRLNFVYCIISKLKNMKQSCNNRLVIFPVRDSVNTLKNCSNPPRGEETIHVTNQPLGNTLGNSPEQSHADDSSTGEKDESTKSEPNPRLECLVSFSYLTYNYFYLVYTNMGG